MTRALLQFVTPDDPAPRQSQEWYSSCASSRARRRPDPTHRDIGWPASAAGTRRRRTDCLSRELSQAICRWRAGSTDRRRRPRQLTEHAREPDHAGTERVIPKIFARREPDDVAALTDRDRGFEGQPARELIAQGCEGNRTSYHERACSADADGVEMLSCPASKDGRKVL